MPSYAEILGAIWQALGNNGLPDASFRVHIEPIVSQSARTAKKESGNLWGKVLSRRNSSELTIPQSIMTLDELGFMRRACTKQGYPTVSSERLKLYQITDTVLRKAEEILTNRGGPK